MASGECLTRDDFYRGMGRYATKDDLARMEVRWMGGLMVASAGVGAAVVLVWQRLAG